MKIAQTDIKIFEQLARYRSMIIVLFLFRKDWKIPIGISVISRIWMIENDAQSK